MPFGVWVLFFLLSEMLWAQEFPASTVIKGMAGTGIGLQGIAGLAANPSSVAELSGFEAMASAEDRFLAGALKEVGLVAALPYLHAGVGLSISGFGNEIYRENRISLSYARKLQGNFSLGLSLGLLQTRIREYGQNLKPIATLAFQWQAIDEIRLAGSLRNPFRSSRAEWDRLPTILAIGLAYLPMEELAFYLDLKKDMDAPLELRLGMNYALTNFLSLRLGVRPRDAVYGFGAGIQFKARLVMNLAVQVFPALPPALSIGFHWK